MMSLLSLFSLTFFILCCVCKKEIEQFPPEDYPGNIIRVSKATFNKYIFTKKRDYYVLLSFTTDDESCGICQMIGGNYKSMADNWVQQVGEAAETPTIYFTELMFTEQTQPLAQELGLQSLPSLMLFKPGKKDPVLYNPEGNQPKPEPLTGVDTPSKPRKKPNGLGKEKYRARGKFGPKISKNRWEADQKSIGELARPRTAMNRQDAWTAKTIGAFVSEHSGVEFDGGRSNAFNWSKVPQYVVVASLAISAVLYIYQTFLAYDDEGSTTIKVAVVAASSVGMMGKLKALSSSIFWFALLLFLLVVYLLIIGGVYYTKLNPTSFWGPEHQQGLSRYIQPGMRGQYSVESVLILGLGLLTVLPFIGLTSLYSCKFTMIRVVLFLICGPAYAAGQLGLIYLFMNKYAPYLQGTTLHAFFQSIFAIQPEGQNSNYNYYDE